MKEPDFLLHLVSSVKDDMTPDASMIVRLNDAKKIWDRDVNYPDSLPCVICGNIVPMAKAMVLIRQENQYFILSPDCGEILQRRDQKVTRLFEALELRIQTYEQEHDQYVLWVDQMTERITKFLEAHPS